MAKTSRSRQKTAFHAKGILIGKKCSYTEMRKYIRGGGSRAADKIQGIWKISVHTNGGFVIEYAHILGIFIRNI